MADSGGELEAEYESEPEEETMFLRRRREASDDDDDEEREVVVQLGAKKIGYYDDTDGGDGAPEYYDGDDYVDDLFFDELERLGLEEEEEEEECDEEVAERVALAKLRGKEKVNDAGNDALAVPRLGSFYMHDDRFVSPHRQNRDQRRKKHISGWKDDQKWTHDKYELMMREETHYKDLNPYEVHGRSQSYRQGQDQNNSKGGGYKAKESGLHSKSCDKGGSARIVKGRGPVRYKPLSWSYSVNSPVQSMQSEKTRGTSSKKNPARVFSPNNQQQVYRTSPVKTSNADSTRALSTKCKQSTKPSDMSPETDPFTVISTKSQQSLDLGMASYTDSASVFFHGINANSDSLPFNQHLLAPNMSPYLQAIHPASYFHHENTGTQKRVVQPESRNIGFPASVLSNQIIHVPQSNELVHGNVMPDIPHATNGVSPVVENYFINQPFQYSVPGSTYMASFESRDQTIGSSFSIPFTHQATMFQNQLNRVPSLAQHPVVEQLPVESIIQPPSHVIVQKLHSSLGIGSTNLFGASSLSFCGPGILESLTGSIPSKVASPGAGSNIISLSQSNRAQGVQDFNATPVPVPEMQTGPLHHGRFFNPVIDLASTGYTIESQAPFRNPDLTWPTILPAAAQDASATYHPSHVSPDGSSYVNLTMMSSVNIASCGSCTSGPSNEAGTSGPNNGSLQCFETERVNNEREIQQFKPTRYSKMNMKE